MSRVKTRAVMLEAKQAVELEPGVVLPPGNYNATEKQIGVAYMGQWSWTDPQYKIEATADQLASMGATPSAGVISIEFDVTKFVRSGQLTPT